MDAQHSTFYQITSAMEVLKQEMESEVVTSNSHWNADITESYKVFLLCNGTQYPTNVTQNMKRNFKKRDSDFEVLDGQLFYKKSGGRRLALSDSKEWLHVFQVRCGSTTIRFTPKYCSLTMVCFFDC